MKLATEEVEFSLNNIMYYQADDIAMGFPLGATMVIIFIGYLEYKILPDFDLDCKYLRYVGDCFIISISENIYRRKFLVDKNKNRE